MPMLANFLGALFTSLAAFFGAIVSALVAIVLAAVAVFGLLWGALVFAAAELMSGLTGSFPALGPIVVSALWAVLPDNTAACIAVTVSADVLCTKYRVTVRRLELLASAGK